MSEDHRRNSCVRQAFEVARLLAQETLTLDQIADRFGWTQRTARRYIYALQFAGVDIVDRDAGRAKAYALDSRSWSGLLHLPADGGPR